MDIKEEMVDDDEKRPLQVSFGQVPLRVSGELGFGYFRVKIVANLNMGIDTHHYDTAERILLSSRGQCCKTFNGRKLRIFVISYNVSR